ncbi:hypothetical protein RvY_18244 [Ramazzottius varieornatus]|uniref:G-protein coupled receptors family 1 profile domain-containing protein n=1 Tax=Ramazzottius varieornatus TaxID=947166 RepID=A0A1D1W8G0_RAMVA|nr:hypothetical protein RvY_18244 [Ramazzottius varieornatus]
MAGSMNISVASNMTNQTFFVPSPVNPVRALAHFTICWIEAVALALSAAIPLTAFIKVPLLRTGFNYFLISFLLTNLMYALYLPIFAWDVYFDGWLISTGLCAFYTSLAPLAGILTGWIQLLITGNRLWALYFPHHYRSHHSKRSSLISCLVIWMLALLVVVLFGAVLYKLLQIYPYSGRCFGKADILLETPTKLLFLLLDIAPLVILSAYPWLLRKYLAMRRQHANLVEKNRTATSNVNTNSSAAQAVVNCLGPTATAETTALAAKPLVVQKSSTKFLVLTWVVVCITLFWSPVLLYGVIQSVTGMKVESDISSSAFIVNWMLLCQCTEPWIFVLTVPLLRQTVKQLFRRT